MKDEPELYGAEYETRPRELCCFKELSLSLCCVVGLLSNSGPTTEPIEFNLARSFQEEAWPMEEMEMIHHIAARRALGPFISSPVGLSLHFSATH